MTIVTSASKPAAAVAPKKTDNIGFAASAVLPGEDPRKFDALLSRLFTEFAPQGLLEADAVMTMANALWRKLHLSTYKLAAQARALYGHLFEFPNDQAGFNKYICALIQNPISATQRGEQVALGGIGKDSHFQHRAS